MFPMHNLLLGKLQDIWLPVKSLIDQDKKVCWQASLSATCPVSQRAFYYASPAQIGTACKQHHGVVLVNCFAVVRLAAYPTSHLVIRTLLRQPLHGGSILQ